MTTHTFADLGVPAPLVRALAANDITTPFPIQAATLPDSLSGRDVLGRGKTGSGKTLAFSIPLVAALSEHRSRPNRPTGLVLAPTRELATQITAVLQPLASASGLSVTTIFGGVSQNKQVAALRAGADIVVACPGRLEDLMRQKLITLDDVVTTVLDEADHMADLGFLPGVTRILAATPAGGQRLLFSATLDNGVDKLVRRFLADPVVHSVDEVSAPPAAMTHHVFHVGEPRPRRSWCTCWPRGPGAEFCSCAPSIRRASSPSSSPNRECRRWICTATSPSPPGTATWQRSAAGRHGFWWPPTSRPAAFTSTAWSWWCMSTLRWSTRPICTGRGAPRVPAATVTSSPWCCPSSAETLSTCCVRPGSRCVRRRSRPSPRRCRRLSATSRAARPRTESRSCGEELRRCAAHVRSAPKRRWPPASAA